VFDDEDCTEEDPGGEGMTPYYSKDGIVLYCGDCVAVMQTMPDNSIDAIVTDPPYGLGFMGKGWDHSVPGVEVWIECLRILKPGGYLLAFAGTRTQHRMACAIEDAGFEIRDMIAWVYGSGFSKGFNLKREPICNCIGEGNPLPCDDEKNKHNLRSMRGGNLSQAKHNEEKRREVLFEVVPEQNAHQNGEPGAESEPCEGEQSSMERRSIHRTGKRVCDDPDAGASTGAAERLRAGAHPSGGEDAGPSIERQRGSSPQEPEPRGQQPGQPAGVFESSGTLDDGTLCGRGQCSRCGKLKAEYEGWSTSLKPSLEPITMARKPLIGTVAANVMQYGTGGINVDGCRVGTEAWSRKATGNSTPYGSETTWNTSETPDIDRSAVGRWPANLIHDGSDEVLALFPETTSGAMSAGTKRKNTAGWAGPMPQITGEETIGDSGSAARFFYTAKADSSERRQSKHPTVKPLDLMRYLVRLVCPAGGIVVDPFMGSGSTIEAARAEHCKAVGIELDAAYCADAVARLRQGVLNFAEGE
jgi:DNA modification methylase